MIFLLRLGGAGSMYKACSALYPARGNLGLSPGPAPLRGMLIPLHPNKRERADVVGLAIASGTVRPPDAPRVPMGVAHGRVGEGRWRRGCGAGVRWCSVCRRDNPWWVSGVEPRVVPSSGTPCCPYVGNPHVVPCRQNASSGIRESRDPNHAEPKIVSRFSLTRNAPEG